MKTNTSFAKYINQPINEEKDSVDSDFKITDKHELRPEVNQTQINNANELYHNIISKKDKRLGATLIASALPAKFSKEYLEKGSASLVGHRIINHADIAHLSQIYRDPRFETLHVVYTRDDQVVGHGALTNRLPGMVSFSKAKDNSTVIAMHKRAHELGADGVWMIHNHPSGRSTPSNADMQMTHNIHDNFERFRHIHLVELKGHIVIDHDEYSHIHKNEMFDGTRVEDFIHETLPIKNSKTTYNNKSHALPHDILGTPIGSKEEAVGVAKNFNVTKNHLVAIGLSSSGHVNTITSYPKHLLEGGAKVKELQSLARIRKMNVNAGHGMGMILAVTHEDDFPKYDHLIKSGAVLDVVLHSHGNPNNTKNILGSRRQADVNPIRTDDGDRQGGTIKYHGGLTKEKGST
jgi:proteasome lid subunit RPN8/RPN11